MDATKSSVFRSQKAIAKGYLITHAGGKRTDGDIFLVSLFTLSLLYKWNH